MTSIQTITLITAIVGAICGICGAVLGVINTWNQLSRNRVRLKVIPKLGYVLPNKTIMTGMNVDELQEHYSEHGVPSLWCIEVVNLSAFAVTISSLGFGKAKGEPLHCFIFEPGTMSGKKWPTRLEPREAETFLGKVGQSLQTAQMKKPIAYAETDCGVVCYGTSPILQKEFAECVQQDSYRRLQS